MEIKLPRLKLEYNRDDGFSLGKLSLPLIIGFGIHWAWVYLTMFNGKTIFFWNAVDGNDSAGLFYLASLAFLIIALFSYGLFSRAFRRLFATSRQRTRNRLIGAGCACIGTILMCFADHSTLGGLFLLGAGGITTGTGSAILLMSYGVSFGQCDTATIVSSTALSLIVGIMIYAALFNLTILGSARAFLVAALPLFECYCLYKSSSVLVDKLEFASITLKVQKRSFAPRLIIPGIFFGFALGSTRYEAIVDMRAMGGADIQAICITLAAVITCILMIGVILTQKQYLNFMFRTLLPLITIALVWIYFDNGQLIFLSTLFFLVCYLLFESVMWVNYSDISQRFRLTAFIVFGFGRGSLALGALIGALVTRFGSEWGFALGLNEMVLLTLGSMIIAYATLPTEKEIRACITNESDNPIGDMIERQTANQPKNEEIIRAGRFKRKCETIANRYLLSKKETEVLFLLAKGRNAAIIQETLFISEGTARTHMRHIYKKLDVHTQQELIDLVDSTEVSVQQD